MVIFDKRIAGLTELALARFVTRARRAVGLKKTVDVLLTTDAAMQSLNRRFRGKNAATDVLSFPAAPSRASQVVGGELAISAGIAARNAHARGHSAAEEVKILVLHGLLHLRGYDHETDRGQMARREFRLRSRLGLPAGLIERTTAPTSRPRSRTASRKRA
jgi:probable rRNA maturation factor